MNAEQKERYYMNAVTGDAARQAASDMRQPLAAARNFMSRVGNNSRQGATVDTDKLGSLTLDLKALFAMQHDRTDMFKF